MISVAEGLVHNGVSMKDHSPVYSRSAVSLSDAVEASRLGADGDLSERFREINGLAVLLREQERLCEAAESRADWLREVAATLLTPPRWWALIPAAWRLKRQLRILRSRGLFDGEAYLKQYPDVAATGMNPLQHYLLHGIHEGRPPSVPQA